MTFEVFVMQMSFPICSKTNMVMYRTRAQLSLNPSRDSYAKNVFILFCQHTRWSFSFLQVSVFTSFATTGNPNSNLIDADMESVVWKSAESQQPPFKCLNFDEHLSYINLPESERLAIWNELYDMTNTRLFWMPSGIFWTGKRLNNLL